MRWLLWSSLVMLCGLAGEAQSKTPANLAAPQDYALIYNGPISDPDSNEAIAAVVKQAGLPVVYLDNLDDLPARLAGARLFIIGGTEDDVEPLVHRFTPAIAGALKRYLRQGGRYLGICGGAFVASLGWADEGNHVKALGLVPAESDDYDGDFSPKIYDIRWLGEVRRMYYQAGPTFALKPSTEPVRELAYFDDGRIAALMSAYGKGKVAVSGPHPEAPDSWKANAQDGDTMESNIHLAVDLVQALLSDRPVLAPAQTGPVSLSAGASNPPPTLLE
ncbi:hypothetical protein ACL00X_12305 [Aeromonas diversa]|uniref:hypothetical protein n=1 Tax=Aeromonas diversa TaxID=502790 RepID=UPI00399FFEE5